MVVKRENGGRLWRFRKPKQSHDSGGCHGQLLDVAHGRSNTKKTVLRADYPDAVVRTDQSERTGDPEAWGCVMRIDPGEAADAERPLHARTAEVWRSPKHPHKSVGDSGARGWIAPPEARAWSPDNELRHWGWPESRFLSMGRSGVCWGMAGVTSHCAPCMSRQEQLLEIGGERSVCRSQVEGIHGGWPT